MEISFDEFIVNPMGNELTESNGNNNNPKSAMHSIFFKQRSLSSSKIINKDNVLNVFLELKLYDYFLFLTDFIYLTNVCLFFL